MRNTLVGGALAIVLIVVLFAAATYGRHPAVVAGPQGALEDDFVGQQKFGSWALICNEAKVFPRAPSNGRTGNSEGTAPKEEGPPQGWKLPRCIVGLALHNPKNPEDEIRVTFRHISFRRVLALFVRLPHSEAAAGDAVQARFDSRQWDVPVRCNPRFCLAIQSIKFADVPAVQQAKTFAIAFHPSGSDKAVLIPVPTEGLGDALKTMRRLNH